MQSLYAYQNYRKYLGDFYLEKKSKNPLYSYKLFSEAAGIKSPNYLTLIVEGERNLTITNVHYFARAMKLRPDETEFFEALVLFNQSKAPLEQTYYRDRLHALKKVKPASILRSSPLEVLKYGHTPGVMVLAHGRNFEDSVQKCSDELPLGEKSIRKTLKELIEIKLLCEVDGVLMIGAQQTTFHDPKSLSQYQEQYLYIQLENSLRAFKTGYRNKKAKFISHSFTIPKGALDEIQEELSSLIENLTEKMDRKQLPGAEELVQINIQTFKPKVIGKGKVPYR